VTRHARHLVGVAVLVLVASCVGTPGVDPATTELRNDRGTDCPTAEDYEQRLLPDRPEPFTNETVADFARAYEEARVWNENLDAHHELGVSGQATVANRTDSGFVVIVSGGVTKHDCAAGHSVADGFMSAAYFVNESVVVRANPDPGTVDAVDPRVDGEVVERWSNDSNESNRSNGPDASTADRRSLGPLDAHSPSWSSSVRAASAEEPGPRAVTRSPSTVTLVSASSSASQFAPAAFTSSSTQ
jgi:hypothetical protein